MIEKAAASAISFSLYKATDKDEGKSVEKQKVQQMGCRQMKESNKIFRLKAVKLILSAHLLIK